MSCQLDIFVNLMIALDLPVNTTILIFPDCRIHLPHRTPVSSV
jgi:hypothetical protein